MNDGTQNSKRADPGLEQILDLLACPHCSGALSLRDEELVCSKCSHRHAVRGGTPLLARSGTTETWTDKEEPAQDSEAYQQRYRSVDNASAYNAAYRDKLFKRMSTAREYRLLDKLLSSQSRCGIILDIPCGGGRLSPHIAPFADLLVEADIAEGQVLYGRAHSSVSAPRIWMTASAFHIPFRDEAVDGTVCCRLCHHLPTDEERVRLMRELLRVSKRFVIMTYFDYHSLKNTLRRLRRFIDHKPPKMTMTTARVREIAAENGATLVRWPALSQLSSGHRYALMVKPSRDANA